ncbi:MAG: IS256 family transposase [Xanthobacteraceae bacterium]
MSDANVVKLLQPGSFGDPLTEVLRNGARALLAQAIEAEVAEFLAKHVDLKTATGLRRMVRHGHLPEREVMTGIGPVGVRQPRVRDRGAAEDDAGRIRFTPAILPPYARRSRSLEVLIPILYLKGISTGDFEEALAALLGKDAPGLSPSSIARLKEVWLDEHEHWSKRDLAAKRYVYVWADGIYLQARLEDTKQCILVIIGATPEGKKELLGFTDGARESAQDWRELLLDLQNRGLAVAPELAVADGALGFWKALGELWPTTREQRCWVHKTANVLNKLPKSQQPKAKRSLQEIWMAETNKDAEAAFDAFIAAYQLKYDKAAECLAKDRQALLAFYDFPAEHWKHLRTSNPIESTFATVRHRTIRSKGCLSNKTALAMVFKLVDAAQKSWRRLDGHNQLPKLIQGVTFTDGIEVAAKPASSKSQTAAA